MKRQWAMFAVTLLIGGPLAAADWPQFRGPGGAGISTETGLPTTWSKTDGLRWKVELPKGSRGLSSPVVVGDRIYLSACSGAKGDRLHVLAYALADGKLLWHRQLQATGLTHCHPKTCMAAPTPVADASGVYVLFATADLVAYDQDGTMRWYRSLVGDYPTISNQVGMAASPILYKDLLIVPMDNAGESFLAGIDTRYGQNRWKVERNRVINWTTPVLRTVQGKTELLFQTSGNVTAFDPETGRKLWEFQGEGPSTIPSPTISGERVLLPGRPLVAIEPAKDGAKPSVAWKSVQMQTGYCSPVSYRGKVYAVTSAGVIVCSNESDGKLLWQERVKGPFAASPVIADGLLYAVNEKGVTFVLNIKGDQPELIATNDLADEILATPAVADGALIFRSDTTLYCVGKKK